MSLGPLPGSMTEPRRQSALRDLCERLGYRLDAPGDARADALARPTADARTIHAVGETDAGDPTPLAVEFVDAPSPAATLTAVGRAAREDRTCLLVPETTDAATRMAELLASPTGVRSVDGAGNRTFHAGADRVHLEGGGLALYDAGSAIGRPTFRWFEEAAVETRDDGRSGSDDRRLILEVDGDLAAVLEGVDALACPGADPTAFEHHYRRESDRLFHVYDADGREVGVFSGVAAMRDRGFHPVPAPVVPERHLPGPVGDAWAVLPPRGERLLVAGGERELPAP